MRAAQVKSKQQDIELIRQWWLAEMIRGNAPLRETLVLFFEGTFGSSTELIDAPHSIHGRNALFVDAAWIPFPPCSKSSSSIQG